MTERKKIIAIPGSLSQRSANMNLINAIIELYSNQLDIKIFQGLSKIPPFNPDLDNETPPEEVIQFRTQLKEADGILICTPEYAMGVPGTLKNAIDWTVSSMEFSDKPVALITASTSGKKAHAALLDTLTVIEAKMTEQTQLLVSFVKIKVSKESKITDEKTLKDVNDLIIAFDRLIPVVIKE